MEMSLAQGGAGLQQRSEMCEIEMSCSDVGEGNTAWAGALASAAANHTPNAVLRLQIAGKWCSRCSVG